MDTSKTKKPAVVESGIRGLILIIVGLIIVVLFLFVAIEFSGEGEIPEMAISFILMIPGILLIRRGIRNKLRVRRFKQYVNFISVLSITSIDELAAKMGKSSQFVNKDLQTMINKGFFCNAKIDPFANEIIIGSGIVTHEDEISLDVAVELSCEACGARVIVAKGRQIICEYCGSLIG